MADSKISDLTDISLPDLADLLEMVDVSDTTMAATGTNRKATLARLLGTLFPAICEGRLTLESGVGFSTSDQTAKSTLYFTPINGNRVSLYDGTRWQLYVFTERSLALSGLTSGKNYDVFLYDNAGTLTLELSAAWTNDSTRADALTTQDGISVKSGSTTRRYLGTIRTTGTTTTEDSVANRLVWNKYNQQERRANKSSTSSHTYNSATVRSWNNDATVRCAFVVGDACTVHLNVRGQMNAATSGGTPRSGIGLDSTTAYLSTEGVTAAILLANNDTAATMTARFGVAALETVAAGYHFAQALEDEVAALTSTFSNIAVSAALLM